MTSASWPEYFFLARWSQPADDRQLYRLVKKHRVARIFELGVGDFARTLRLLRVAGRYCERPTIKYAAADLFDARPADGPQLSLIEAYRLLQATSATVRLVPGDPSTTLASVANAHQGTDLLLIASCISVDALRGLSFFLPRMLHPQSVVMHESRNSDGELKRLTRWSLEQVAQMAAANGRTRAA